MNYINEVSFKDHKMYFLSFIIHSLQYRLRPFQIKVDDDADDDDDIEKKN